MSKSFTEGVRNMPHQNMLLWYIDYFELEALEKHQMQEVAISELLLSA